GKTKGASFDKLELVDRLLPLYGQIFQRLAAQGVEWVQIDEPILTLDLPRDWKNAFERVYNLLQKEPLKKLVATYFGGLEDNLGLAAGLPVDGLHIDLVRAPQQYRSFLIACPPTRSCPWAWSTAATSGVAIWRRPWRSCITPTNAWATVFGWRRPAHCCTARWIWSAKTNWMPS